MCHVLLHKTHICIYTRAYMYIDQRTRRLSHALQRNYASCLPIELSNDIYIHFILCKYLYIQGARCTRINHICTIKNNPFYRQKIHCPIFPEYIYRILLFLTYVPIPDSYNLYKCHNRFNRQSILQLILFYIDILLNEIAE